MNIFDKDIEKLIGKLASEKIVKLTEAGDVWELVAKNPFLMERDTKIELGGYPKQSINIITASSRLRDMQEQLKGGVYCIGDPKLLTGKEKHISFGKIVLLETEDIEDSSWYDFTQAELITDAGIRMKDIMLRQSPTHYNINLRVSQNAYRSGFDAGFLGRTVYDAYTKMDRVRSATVIMIFGESRLYTELLEIAEHIKEITLTLNHIFDGINMDCGSCDLNEVCMEVEGLRELHKKNTKV
ncbi:MAG: hypothetical protein MJ131_07565 [Lachnospiraceae bacterium]|nr:hypothetical protein [Lachnospiraceae bacterium]